MLAISTADKTEVIKTKMLCFYKIQKWKYTKFNNHFKIQPQVYV